MIQPKSFFGRSIASWNLVDSQMQNRSDQTQAYKKDESERLVRKDLLRIDTGVDVVSSTIEGERRGSVAIGSIHNRLELTAYSNAPETYSVRLEFEGKQIAPILGIPGDLPFETVVIAVSILTASASIMSKRKGKAESIQGTSCGGPAGTIGYAADDVCSLGPKSGIWTFWWPCAGEFKIDLTDCCRMHDRSLFCVTNELERIEVDLAFNACVAGELMRRGRQEMSGWCAWVFYPLLVVFAGVGIKTLADIFFILYGFTYKGDYLNFDDKNKDSCLCGGTKPTFKCYTDPRDPDNYLCFGKTTPCCTRANGNVRKSNEGLACDPRQKQPVSCTCERCCWKNGAVVYPKGGDVRDCCPNTPGDPSDPRNRCSR